MARSRLILSVILTDNTFERQRVRDIEMWVGRCFFCRTRLAVSLDGEAAPQITIEHVVPRSHGGDNNPENLAIACATCNAEKGRRHDNKHRADPARLELESKMIEQRKKRWRNPPM